MAAKTPTIAVNDVLSNLENVVAADTAVIVGDLELLTKINNAHTERYKSMTEAAKGLENDSAYLKGKYAELNKYTKQVDEIEDRVGDLEKLVGELDEWCSELEVKVRRLSNARR